MTQKEIDTLKIELMQKIIACDEVETLKATKILLEKTE